MDYFFLLAAGALGAILGSFLNAFSYRFNTGRGLGGRSYCDTCARTLGPLDLVPVFSYLFLKGKCRYCGAKISIQNLLVEIAAAMLSIFIFLSHPSVLGYAFSMLVWMILLFVVVYDLRHTIIPWSASITLAVLAAASLFFNFDTATWATPTLSALLAGPLLALPLFLLSLMSKAMWMGWGDSALEVSLGWLLGATLGASALMYAFWSGALVGIVLMLWARALPAHRQVTMKSELPFAPFLVFGMYIAYFFHVDLFSALTIW